MRGFRMPLLAVCGLVAACSTLPPVGPTAAIDDLPWTEVPADQVVLQARALVERGEPKRALSLCETVLAEQPRHADALRLRQDILRERGRRGLLWSEAEQRLLADPRDPQALYLHGRIVSDPNDKLQNFGRAAEVAPRSLWPWLGLAHTLRSRDPERALRIYERLHDATGAHPLVGIAHAAVLRQLDRHEAAIEIYSGLRQDPRLPGVGDLGLAQSWLARDRRDEAWTALLAAMRQRPFDPGVQSLVHGWLQAGVNDDKVAQVFDVLREDPVRLQAFGSGDGVVILADLLGRLQQPQAVRSLLEEAGVTARRPLLRRLQRRLCLALGDVAGFLALVRADVPLDLVGAETNQLRGRWLSLLQGPWHAGDPLATPAQSTALLEALLAVGWLVEVEHAAAVAARRWPTDGASFLLLRDEARRQLAFEAGLRRLLYQGYQSGDTGSLAQLLERVRELSQRVLGRDVVGSPQVFSVPMVGELVDPFTGALAEHFDRYNRHVVLGRRSGGTAEGMLLVRLSLAELPASRDLQLPGRCFEVVAIDRDVRALAGVLGGDLAGVALLNHFLIDYDAVREWARGIADRRRIAAEDGGALVHDPLPAGADFDPVDVSWRLALLSPVQDSGLDAAVLDTIRQHERQHLVDSFHYLPIESNLRRGLGLLFRFGLSPSAIEAEMERRAELASLATSPHTELVLAHIADFLSEPDGDSPHHRGFGELGRQIAAELQELGVPPEHCVPSRWHLVEREVVRTAARRLLEQVP